MALDLMVDDPSVQMAVSLQITGIEFWYDYLEDLRSSNDIDQATSDSWFDLYDGYQLIWNFSGPQVTVSNDAIDAACIHGSEYAGGGFCCGIEYTNTTPSLWAIWFSDDDFDNWTDSVGFASAVDDTAQWRIEDGADYASSWTAKRWMPKEQRSELYYQNEYRFTSGDKVDTYSLEFNSVTFYTRKSQQTITLTGAAGLS